MSVEHVSTLAVPDGRSLADTSCIANDLNGTGRYQYQPREIC